MKNKITLKSNKILSFDSQVKMNKPVVSLDSFMKDYFSGKITSARYLSLIKQYKE